MRKGIKLSTAGNMRRKATNSLKQAAYMLMWGEEPPKGKKKA